ncbi:MAG TPA: hypothetical protein DCQ37_07905 [Desulfobacteraceae bacterium]|nr:hypothetical protein [Desulfobacteraceae bacterium]
MLINKPVVNAIAYFAAWAGLSNSCNDCQCPARRKQQKISGLFNSQVDILKDNFYFGLKTEFCR